MSRSGQLFVSGRDDLGEEVFAIVTLPAEPSAGRGRREPPGSIAGPGRHTRRQRNDRAGANRRPTNGATTDGPDIFPTQPPDPNGPSAAPRSRRRRAP